MTTATTFSPVLEAKESSKRSSVPEALGSVSNLAQQNFETPKNLVTLSTLFLLLSSASK
jgi:hypothetical protein